MFLGSLHCFRVLGIASNLAIFSIKRKACLVKLGSQIIQTIPTCESVMHVQPRIDPRTSISTQKHRTLQMIIVIISKKKGCDMIKKIARLVTRLARGLGSEIVAAISFQAGQSAPWQTGTVVSSQQQDSNPGPSTLACLRQHPNQLSYLLLLR